MNTLLITGTIEVYGNGLPPIAIDKKEYKRLKHLGLERLVVKSFFGDTLKNDICAVADSHYWNALEHLDCGKYHFEMARGYSDGYKISRVYSHVNGKLLILDPLQDVCKHADPLKEHRDASLCHHAIDICRRYKGDYNAYIERVEHELARRVDSLKREWAREEEEKLALAIAPFYTTLYPTGVPPGGVQFKERSTPPHLISA